MTLQPPPGQGPIDPRGAFSPPPPPGQGGGGGWAPPPPGFLPPMMPPPGWFPPPPRQRGFARAIFTTLATTLFGISILLNLYLLVFTGLTGNHEAKETVIVEGAATEKVVIIPIVNSMMLEAQAQAFDKMMDRAEKDANVKAVVLQIDTPGGEVTSADEMYHRVMVYKSKHATVPIIVSMGGMATSGGYYAACAADYLVAQPTTITGNIGVLMPQYNLSKLADNWGIQDTTLHSTGADYKTAGSWLKPPNEADRAYLLDLIDTMFAQFKWVVTTGRGSRLTQPINIIANGKAYTSGEALKLGLVDQIGYLADAYTYAGTKAGLKNMMVVRYEEPSTLLEMLSSSKSTLPPAKASSDVQINGIHIDADHLSDLLRPRLLYLWRGN
jgi:protease-4